MDKIGVLVAVANYPSPNKKLVLAYVHTRNKYYIEHGIDVTVLSFRAKECYTIDGIKVITLKEYKAKMPKFRILICHAPNIREHWLFLKKYGSLFERFIFFFHGHEVLMNNHIYPASYFYVKRHIFKMIFGDIYDYIKLKIWNSYYPSVVQKSWLVFVSKWMMEEFEKWTKIPYAVFSDRHTITYNCIGKPFEKAVYDFSSKKEYDFITIRHNLDNSKYGIDIVNELAESNPKYKFLIIGKGEFFSHFNKAKNITWIDANLKHEEIVKYLQKARCALMPTRADAQGLMMCEMASIGMPVITSNISVCYESLGDFDNVAMIDNDHTTMDLSSMLEELEARMPYKKNNKYYNENTSLYEVNIIKKMIGECS